MKQGFIFYRSFAEAMEMLSADDYTALMKAIINYALDGVLPEEGNLSALCQGMFILMKPQIDANNRRAENGKKGGRPKKKDIEKRAEPMPEEMRKKWGINTQKSD